jgi:2-amino-4-hydroxy-6-hydroxymethyldihydropteridine diphosphokinase
VTSAGAQTRRAFVALGSNLGDRWAYLRMGLDRLPDLVNVSPVYESAPVGGPPGQGPYLNMVAELWTNAAPVELLAAARQAETVAGRARSARWGPRTLDVDILLIGDLAVDLPDLQVPHPRMWGRGFVLLPLADLAPELAAGHLDDSMRAGVSYAGTLTLDRTKPG